MEGFSSSPIIIDGESIGTVEMFGHEIHMQIDKRKALVHARRIIREYFAPKIEELGYLTTISTGDSSVDRFLKRLGFYRIGGMGSITLYRIDAVKIK